MVTAGMKRSMKVKPLFDFRGHLLDVLARDQRDFVSSRSGNYRLGASAVVDIYRYLTGIYHFFDSF